MTRKLPSKMAVPMFPTHSVWVHPLYHSTGVTKVLNFCQSDRLYKWKLSFTLSFPIYKCSCSVFLQVYWTSVFPLLWYDLVFSFLIFGFLNRSSHILDTILHLSDTLQILCSNHYLISCLLLYKIFKRCYNYMHSTSPIMAFVLSIKVFSYPR